MLAKELKVSTKESSSNIKALRKHKSIHLPLSKVNLKVLSEDLTSPVKSDTVLSKDYQIKNEFVKPFITNLLSPEELKTLLDSEVSNEYIVKLYSKVEPFLINEGIEINKCNRSLPSFVSEYFKKFMDYNLNSGKRLRTVTVIRISCGLLKGYNSTYEHKVEFLTVAFLCSFLIELVQMAVLAADDVMDSSLTRRKKTCWYLNDGVGLAAINDAIWGFTLSNLYFKRFMLSDSLSLLLMNELNELKLRLCCGQGIDGMLQNFVKNWSEENLIFENFELVSQYKTTFYTFYYPSLFPYLIHSVFNSTNSTYSLDLQNYRTNLETYTLHLGLLFGAQDDYLDVFGNYEISGKIGSDIEEAKCTFLLIKALENLNSFSFCYSGQCRLLNSDSSSNSVCSCNRRTKTLLKESLGIKEEKKMKTAREILVNCEVEKEYQKYCSEVVDDVEACTALDKYPVAKQVLGIILKRIKSRQD